MLYGLYNSFVGSFVGHETQPRGPPSDNDQEQGSASVPRMRFCQPWAMLGFSLILCKLTLSTDKTQDR